MGIRSKKMFNGLNKDQAYKLYREEAKKCHPDLNPGIDDSIFKNLQNEFEAYLKGNPYNFTNLDGDEWECPEWINEFFYNFNVTVEIIGSWIWVSGEFQFFTDEFRTELKSKGFRFSSKKKAWYFSGSNKYRKYAKFNKLEDVRNAFDSRTVKKQKEQNKIKIKPVKIRPGAKK
jgi:hypothetical protein